MAAPFKFQVCIHTPVQNHYGNGETIEAARAFAESERQYWILKEPDKDHSVQKETVKEFDWNTNSEDDL